MSDASPPPSAGSDRHADGRRRLSPSNEGVCHRANDFIPRTSRTRSAEGPGGDRQSPQRGGRKSLLVTGIPGWSGSGPEGRIGLCKPEVAGSIPARSTRKSAGKWPYGEAAITRTDPDWTGLERFWNGQALTSQMTRTRTAYKSGSSRHAVARGERSVDRIEGKRNGFINRQRPASLPGVGEGLRRARGGGWTSRSCHLFRRRRVPSQRWWGTRPAASSRSRSRAGSTES